MLPPIIVQDQIPEIKVSIPDTKAPALIPFVRSPVLRYHTQKSLGRGAFQPGEYDLAEVGRVEDTDSYVRQAFNKKVGLMFKEGWDLGGPNLRTIKYIKTRLAQIVAATRTPTNTLFRDIGSALVRKSNSFLIKVRKTEASGGKVRREPGKEVPLKPVAGYFIAPAETMEFELSGNRISRWRQKMPNGDVKHHMPRDVIHIFCDRKEGFVFGTPILVPVMDDVRALRKIEENVEMLVYQHIFPLFHYKVGTPEMPAGIDEAGRREIDVVKQEIQFMPSEGGIVTPERHEITAIGAEGRALRADSYLEHFKKRVFSGLGVSAVDMGEGETANRATADNMSRNMVDSVKDLQQLIEDAVNEFIIKELLLESTFGVSVLDEDNIVTLKFKEVDLEAKTKKESHAVDMYVKNAIDHDEMRRVLGKEPMLLPTPEESQNEQDTPDKFPQWNRIFWTMFDRPKLLMQSIDEPYSLAAMMAAKDSSISGGEKDVDAAGKKQQEQEVALEKERGKAKVAVAKATPRPRAVRDAIETSTLGESFQEIKTHVVERANSTGQLDKDWVPSLVRATLEPTKRKLVAQGMIAFKDGFASAGGDITNKQFVGIMGTARTEVRARVEKFVTKLANNVIDSLRRNTDDNMTPTELSMKARAVFDSMQFRTDFIEDVEVRKAANLGRSRGFFSRGITQVFSIINSSSDPCPTCISRHNKAIQTNFSVPDLLPPHHAHCNCFVSADQVTKEYALENAITPQRTQSTLGPPEGVLVKGPKGSNIDDVPKDLEASGQATSCPKCGKTALKKNGNFNCRNCGHSFQLVVDEDFEDATLEECVLSVKKSLRKKNPGMSEDKLKESAFKICNSRMKGKK